MTLDQKLRVAADEMHDFGSSLAVPSIEGHRSETRFREPRLAYAAAAALSVLAAIGLITVIAPLGSNDPAVQQPIPTTAPATAPNTANSNTVPPTTLPEAIAPIPAEASPLAPTSVVWTRVGAQAAFVSTGDYAFMEAVTVGGPGLVAVGADCPGTCAYWQSWSDADWEAAVWVSGDGDSWSRLDLPDSVVGGIGDQVMLDVAGVGPRLVAVGYDDQQWAPVSTNEEIEALPGPNGAIWASADGLEWERLEDPDGVFSGPENIVITSVVARGSRLIAGGWVDDKAAVWTSEDGYDWTRIPHQEDIFGGLDAVGIHELAAGGSGVVAVGVDFNEATWEDYQVHPETKTNEALNTGWPKAAVWYSVDGFSWQRVDRFNPEFGGQPEGHADPLDPTGAMSYAWNVVALENGFVAGGYGQFDRAIWVSEDGLTWIRIADDDERWDGGKIRSAIDGFVTDGARFAPLPWDKNSIRLVWPEDDRHPEALTRYATWDVPHTNLTDGAVFEGRLIAVGFDEAEAAVWIGQWDE